MVIYRKGNRYTYFIGICKKFQWFGIMISTDNAIWDYDFFLFEFRFLWFRAWYTYKLAS